MIKLPPSATDTYYLRWKLHPNDALTDADTFYIGGVFPSEAPNAPEGALEGWSVIPGDTGEPKALTRDEVRRMMLMRNQYEIVAVKLKIKYVISFGGGAASFVLAKWMLEKYGDDNVDVVMAALHDDERDGERLDIEFERVTGKKVTRITIDKMDSGSVGSVRELSPDEPAPYSVWDIFFYTGRMGSTMADPCSRVLKREVMRTYMLDKYDPETTVMCVGISVDEIDRLMAITRNWKREGFTVTAPLADAELTRDDIERELKNTIGYMPTLYREGRLHKNCGGACVKAGFSEWARFLWYRPDEFARWEHMELMHQQVFNHQNTILRNQTYTYDKVIVDNTTPQTVPMFPDLSAPETVTQRKKVYDTKPYSLRDFRKDMQIKWAAMLPGQDPFSELVSMPSCHFCNSM